MTVLLKDGTVGTVDIAEVGQTVEVTLNDENGNLIARTGEVIEILEG